MTDAAITADLVRDDCTKSLFGCRIVENVVRGKLVEAMVNLALRNTGRHQCDAWGGWDFEHADGTRLEVKQAASRQTWDPCEAHASSSSCTNDHIMKRRRISFDIKARAGHFAGSCWKPNPERKRFAQVYVFAHHPRTDASADHRDPEQWQFYVVATTDLPPTDSISRAAVCERAKAAAGGDDPAVRITGLPERVAHVLRRDGRW